MKDYERMTSQELDAEIARLQKLRNETKKREVQKAQEEYNGAYYYNWENDTVGQIIEINDFGFVTGRELHSNTYGVFFEDQEGLSNNKEIIEIIPKKDFEEEFDGLIEEFKGNLLGPKMGKG